jgi:hypothetical protein
MTTTEELLAEGVAEAAAEADVLTAATLARLAAWADASVAKVDEAIGRCAERDRLAGVAGTPSPVAGLVDELWRLRVDVDRVGGLLRGAMTLVG